MTQPGVVLHAAVETTLPIHPRPEISDLSGWREREGVLRGNGAGVSSEGAGPEAYLRGVGEERSCEEGGREGAGEVAVPGGAVR